MEKELAQYLNKYDSSSLINKGIGLFNDVNYFSETYNGKMFITPQAIYYFPLRRSDEIEENEVKKNLFSFVFWELLFLIVFIAVNIYFYQFYQPDLFSIVTLLLPILISLWEISSKLMQRYVNRQTQEENAISDMSSFLTYDQLHKELDEYITAQKLQTAYFDQSSVPHPIKFAKDEIYDLSIDNNRGFSTLNFRTEYDEHDFVFQSQPGSLIQRSLMKNGFLKPNQN